MPNIKPLPKPEPFEKFERLTGQLLKVPKKELEEKQAEYDRQKKKKKGADHKGR